MKVQWLWRMVLLILFCLPAGSAWGSSVDGLFGVPLDAPCAVCGEGEIMAAEEASPLFTRYSITPPEPEQGFELYQVRTAPFGKGGSATVVDVSAVAMHKDEAAAKQVFDTLRQRFTEQLGKPEIKDSYNATSAFFRVKGSDRVVTLLLREDDMQSAWQRSWVVFINAMDRGVFGKAIKKARKSGSD